MSGPLLPDRGHYVFRVQTAPHQDATLLPKGAPRSDTVQMTTIASSYDPTPARRAPNKHVTFTAVCRQ